MDRVDQADFMCAFARMKVEAERFRDVGLRHPKKAVQEAAKEIHRLMNELEQKYEISVAHRELTQLEKNKLAFRAAARTNADVWVVAHGGEEPITTTRSGIRVQYMWNFALQQHRYLNVDTDTIMSSSEVDAAFQMT